MSTSKETNSNLASPLFHIRQRVDKHKRLLITPILLLILLWSIVPAIRAYTLVANPRSGKAPNISQAGIPIQTIHFTSTDGVHLAGWLSITSPTAPTIILVHGFKAERTSMLPWARFLYAGGYNVLLFDDRGNGESEGWNMTLGAREAEDIHSAVHFLQQRSDLHTKRIGALGVSLGAGVVLLAAAKEPGLAATIADSAWIDENAQVSRMQSIWHLPVLPYEPTLVNALIGADLSAIRPLSVIGTIAPRAVMLIHSADDQNTTTPLSGEHQLYAAAHTPKEEWIAPSGGHVGAIKAHNTEYKQRVLAFFNQYLRS